MSRVLLQSEPIGLKAIVLMNFSMAALATKHEVVFVVIVLLSFVRIRGIWNF